MHGTICNITKIYEEFGIKFKPYEHYQSGNLQGKVLIVPPWIKSSRLIKNITQKRVAILTGWAIDKESKDYFWVDEAIPLSDHADFSELIEYVKKAQPKKIYTMHGFPEFVNYLRDEGFDAERLKKSTKTKTTIRKELLSNYDLFD